MLDAQPSHQGVCRNDSTETQGGVDVAFHVYFYGFLFLITSVNLCGNSLVLSSLFRHKRLRSCGNHFIFSLALADLLGGVVYTIYNISHMKVEAVLSTLAQWNPCYGLLVLMCSCQMASSYNLVALTTNRFVAAVKPRMVATWFSGFRSLAMSGLIWAAALTLTTSVYIQWNPDSYCGVCRFDLVGKPYSVLLESLISFFIPLMTMTALYSRLLCITKKQVRRISDEASLQGHEFNLLRARMAKKDLALARMASILVGYFAFASVPLAIFLVIAAFCPSCENRTNKYIRATLRLLLHSNSAVNVFIYAGSHQDFREAFTRDLQRLRVIFCRCCPGQRCKRKEVDSVYQPYSDTWIHTAELRTMTQLEAQPAPAGN